MFSKYGILFCLSCTISLTTSHPNMHSRNVITAKPTINTTMIDQNGKDISSSFEKKIFYYNTTEDALNGDKDAPAQAARILNTCSASQGSFVESSCSYKPGVLGSIRLFSYTCKNYKKGVRNKKAGIMEETTYAGSCNNREICVNSRKRENNDSDEPKITAFCINMDAFTSANEAILPDVSGATLTTLLTSPDMETPLMAGQVDIEMELMTSDGHEEEGPGQDCLNCTSLTTEELPSSVGDPFDLDMRALVEYMALAVTGLFLLVVFGI